MNPYDLLAEWYEWYKELLEGGVDIEDTSLVDRTQKAIEEHKKQLEKLESQ